jgi:DNA-binding IclR family transcriptional regulator
MAKSKKVDMVKLSKAYLLLKKIGDLETYSPHFVAQALGISPHLAWRKCTQLRESGFVSLTSKQHTKVYGFEFQFETEVLKLQGSINEDQVKMFIARNAQAKSKNGKKILESIGEGELRIKEIVEKTGLLQPNVAAFLSQAVKSGLIEMVKTGNFNHYKIKK